MENKKECQRPSILMMKHKLNNKTKVTKTRGKSTSNTSNLNICMNINLSMFIHKHKVDINKLKQAATKGSLMLLSFLAL